MLIKKKKMLIEVQNMQLPVEALDFGSLQAVGRQLHNVRLSPIHSLSN